VEAPAQPSTPRLRQPCTAEDRACTEATKETLSPKASTVENGVEDSDTEDSVAEDSVAGESNAGESDSPEEGKAYHAVENDGENSIRRAAADRDFERGRDWAFFNSHPHFH